MKTITTLRNHLFDQLERLAQANTKEEINDEINKSKAVVEISQALMQTASVEAAIIASVKNLNSEFIPDSLHEILNSQNSTQKKPFEFNKDTSKLIDEFIQKKQ